MIGKKIREKIQTKVSRAGTKLQQLIQKLERD
jgi:hypothetical protein